MTTPVSGPTAKGTGSTLDGDGIGSSSDRKKLLGATKRVVTMGEATTKGAQMGKTIANLDTLLFLARKVATKGK